MQAQALQKEISEVGFESDLAPDLEYKIQTFTVLAGDPEAMSASELGSTEEELDGLISELDNLIGSVESARDDLRAISGRCYQAQQDIEEEEGNG